MYLYIKEFTFICYISYIYICQKYTYIFVVYYTCMCFLHIHMLFIHSNVVYTFFYMYACLFTYIYIYIYIYIHMCVCVCACACVITRDDDTIKQQRYTICPPGCDLNAPRGGTIKYICRYRSMRPHHLPAESHS